VCMPRSPTPASSSRQASCGVSTRPSVPLTTSALARIVCRGSITRPAHSLCTLRRADHSATTQHSVPAGGQPLPGGAGYPLGSVERFPRLRLHLFPFPKLRLAQAGWPWAVACPGLPQIRTVRDSRIQVLSARRGDRQDGTPGGAAIVEQAAKRPFLLHGETEEPRARFRARPVPRSCAERVCSRK